ncbi:hypothetical protein Hgul01_00249 [Herpetosiphon gulosus]|uniref:Uncharacterized protein n=1 Tax=Herpetosiphon gulosus TaxID=1973496 RepID=A0ABP9WTD7_9CHLR
MKGIEVTVGRLANIYVPSPPSPLSRPARRGGIMNSELPSSAAVGEGRG